MTMQRLTDANFEAALTSATRPILVVFTSRDCWICAAFATTLQQVVPSVADRVDVATADVDDAPSAAAYYCIDGTPRSLLFRDGEEVTLLRGAWPAEDVIAFITDALQGSAE